MFWKVDDISSSFRKALRYCKLRIDFWKKGSRFIGQLLWFLLNVDPARNGGKIFELVLKIQTNRVQGKLIENVKICKQLYVYAYSNSAN